MDVTFPYKEAITNACGLIGPTTTHMASQSLLIAQRKKPNCQRRKVNQLHIMVKQVFEAGHFDTTFNPIVEEAAEVK